MTTIVAVQTPDKVFIGCDSQVTLGGMQSDTLAVSKVIHNGEYTVGVAGRPRLVQALQYAKLPPIVDDDLDKHVANSFVPVVRNIMVHAGLTPDEAAVILVLRKQVYIVNGDGSFVRNESKVYSIGSGSSYALGALETTGSEAGVAAVENALRVAARYDIGTSGPFKIATIS